MYHASTCTPILAGDDNSPGASFYGQRLKAPADDKSAVASSSKTPSAALQIRARRLATSTDCTLLPHTSPPTHNRGNPLPKNQHSPMATESARMHPCSHCLATRFAYTPCRANRLTFAAPGKGARASLAMRPPHSQVEHGSPLVCGDSAFFDRCADNTQPAPGPELQTYLRPTEPTRALPSYRHAQPKMKL